MTKLSECLMHNYLHQSHQCNDRLRRSVRGTIACASYQMSKPQAVMCQGRDVKAQLSDFLTHKA